MTNSSHFDQSWVSEVTLFGNNDINYNWMLWLKPITHESLWAVLYDEWWGRKGHGVNTVLKCCPNLSFQQHPNCVDREWVIPLSMPTCRGRTKPAVAAVYSGRMETGELGLCVHGSLKEFPEGRWQSYPPRVIFLCFCNHFLSHEGRGEKKKKSQWRSAVKRKVKKSRCNWEWEVVCVCWCVFSPCSLVWLEMMTLSRLKSIGTP